MRDYDIKRGHFKNIDGRLDEIINEIFGEFEKVEGKTRVSYGALNRLDCWLEGKATLWIDTDINTDIDDETARSTNQKYNDFLLQLTGFNAKQRAKRLKDKAKKGTL